MRMYLVTFHKVVLNDTGHDRSVRQRQAIVWAHSKISAAYKSQALFGKATGMVDWRLQANTCEVAEFTDFAA